ncbi:MAG: MFS transporter, partial [Clostridia bacterium]|nr:MFS transporter [Clostridia bacterium]
MNFLHKLFGTTPGKGVQPKEAIAYSVAGFGQNFICTIIGSYITVFMTDALLFGADGVMVGGISGAIAVAILMLGARIFDALNDPIMGSVVDKTRTKWGKCRPYLKWMAFPIGIMTILC